MSAMRTLAIIPARGGSKRIPGKNLRPFLGRPLLQWSIEFARRVPDFARVVVSTDDAQIAAHCQREAAEVQLRPAELASDTAASVDVALHVLATLEASGQSFDAVALLQPTSPVRDIARWRAAFDLIARGADAVIGVSPAQTHPLHVFRTGPGGQLAPWSDASGLQLRSQDLPPAVSVNGSLYLIRSAQLREHCTFFPGDTRGVMCDGPCEDLDLDTEADWIAAEALAAHYGARP